MGIKLGPPTLQSNALLTELILPICIIIKVIFSKMDLLNWDHLTETVR